MTPPSNTDLVVILHQLDDHPDVVAVVLDGDDPHDVGCVLRVRVGAVFVSQHQASVRLVNLESKNKEIQWLARAMTRIVILVDI